MELFDQLNILYTRLAKETDELNSCMSLATNDSTDSRHGLEKLDTNLTSVRHLKSKIQQAYDTACESERNFTQVLSGVTDFVRSLNSQLGGTDSDQFQTTAGDSSMSNDENDLNSDGRVRHKSNEMDVMADIRNTKASKSGLPTLEDFCISDTTLNLLKVYRGINTDHDKVKPNITWDNKSMALQDLGNTLPATLSMSQLLLDRPAFDSGVVVAPVPKGAESNAISVGRHDENILPVTSEHCAKMDNKTRLNIPPQAPVLSFIAQEHLKHFK